MSNVADTVQEFVDGLEGRYDYIEKVEIETPGYGHSIRVTTNYDNDSEDFKKKLIESREELQDELDEHLQEQNFTKDRDVYIHIDW